MEVNSLNSLVAKFFGQLCWLGVLSLDPIVWLDRAIPANTCIPHSFPGNATMQPCDKLTPKDIIACVIN